MVFLALWSVCLLQWRESSPRWRVKEYSFGQ